ncbi:MAG: hypothetical protein NW214_16805 [Pseudanabaenaceae cyanobacterium bins.39]|nr:hypothetical protein [Pseudanabaenaceae cyanobacterium bins.39]
MNWLKKISEQATILGIFAFGALGFSQTASAQLAQYVVYVAGNDPSTIQRVRSVAPNAFPSQINGQTVVQAGLFNSETNANNLVLSLQQIGLSPQKSLRSGNVASSGSVFTPPPTTSSGSIFVPPMTSQPAPTTTNDIIIRPEPTNTSIITPVPQPIATNSLLPQASQDPNFRYIAAVPTNANDSFLLSRVRQFVPSAFLANSGRGTYVHAGAYPNRDSAESVSRYLRSQGIDSRVLYF